MVLNIGLEILTNTFGKQNEEKTCNIYWL
jgi:hypothetical protein